MKLFTSISFLLSVSFVSASTLHNHRPEHDFVECLNRSNDPTLKEVIYTPQNPDFQSVLNFYKRNLRFLIEETPKPQVIVAPSKESQVQTVIQCAKRSELQMRIRSGGHDFEGSSFISDVPFFILDINKFRSISIDAEKKTIWFGAGATLGEVSYAVYLKNRGLSVSLGVWPTVSVGGFISGGGYGGLTRQYGTAADLVIDAIVVDANGEIHDRESMGEDFFWALRGGVGANFGVILAYKLALVDVPEKAASFYVNRTLEENAVHLVHRSQHVVRTMPSDLSFSVSLGTVDSNQTGKPTVQASFICAYRGGGVDELVSIMSTKFPELGVTKNDVFEILWIQYVPFHNSYPIEDYVHYLTSRTLPEDQYFKAKSDFVKDPVPLTGVEVLMRKLLEVPVGVGHMEWTFWGGGIMDTIPQSRIAFPHRGYLFIVFEVAFWNKTTPPAVVEECVDWLRDLHTAFGHYVPDNPRPAYANYRDHDLGLNGPNGTTTVDRARMAWGGPYFGVNFDRLVCVKSRVDSGNLFRNEQSLPVLGSAAKRLDDCHL